VSSTSQSLAATDYLDRAAAVWRRLSMAAVARWASIVLAVSALFMVAAVAGMALYASAHQARFYEGVELAGVPVGGLTQAEARSALERRYGEYLGTTVSLRTVDQRFELPATESGVTLDPDRSVASAFAFGRRGSWWDRSRAWASAFIHGRDLPLFVSVDETILDAQLQRVAPNVTRPPADAAVVMDAEGGPTIVPEMAGIAFDVTSTRGQVVERFRWLSNQPVELVTPLVPPSVTAADLQVSADSARSLMDAPLVITALDRQWGVTADDLKRIVSVPPAGGIEVNREAIRSLVLGIAGEIERPSVDAAVRVDGGSIVAEPGSSSIVVDADRSVESIVGALTAGEHGASLAVLQEPPRISDAQADAAAAQAEALVGAGVALSWDGGRAELGRGDLLAALTIDTEPGRAEPFGLGFDPDVLARSLAPIAERIDVPARDATFRLVGAEIRVKQKSQEGQRLDVDAGAQAIADAVMGNGPRSVRLAIEGVRPKYTESTAKRIKLDDVLADSSTSYAVSSDARRHNVEQASKLETGWLVPPGGQFSYDEHVGNVSKEEGFVTGFGIVASAEGDGRVTTAPVVGGGICQVSTTIFQAAFWAGLQIDERHEHPYWLQTYGEPPRGMKGLDAMVDIEEDWSLDMRFTNTTGNWIAVVVTADGQNVTARILGTDAGWDVQVDQPVISDVVPPDEATYYTESPELAQGEEMQVEHAQEGFTATVHRVVLDREGQAVDETTLSSTYAASRNTILRGTGGADTA
jgi:vancomycin resistance protein YoaR